MAYRVQPSFSTGELDPALHERTNLDKYKSGLSTLRNAFIGKTGRPISRGGLLHVNSTKFNDKKSILFSPPYRQYLIEFGDGFIRFHNLITGAIIEKTHVFDFSYIDYVNFEVSGDNVYIFSGVTSPPSLILKFNFVTGVENSAPFAFVIPDPPAETSRAFTGTGIPVRYAITTVTTKGEESYPQELVVGAGMLPINAGEVNTLVLDTTGEPTASEVRVYRRPVDGIGYGFAGSVTVSAGAATFSDYGDDVDYTHSPPAYLDGSYSTGNVNSKTGIIYQQRLVLVRSNDTVSVRDEIIDASRTGFQNNFTRDFPYSDDSALVFKAGSSGNAKVLRMLDNGGLVAFTTVGIYVNTGALTPLNLAFEKRGNWVIDEKVGPLEIPGSVLFVDKSTNTIRLLNFSLESGNYTGQEVSIFSNHLFENKRVKSWAFQDGDVPIIWCVMDDGTLNALTYQREHEMQAWSHHDTDGLFESVAVVKDTDAKSVAYFTVKRGNKRYIEKTAERFVDDIKKYVLMDAAKSFNSPLSAVATVVAVNPLDWTGSLKITSTSAIFANTAGNGAIGTVFKFFDSDGSAVELTVTAFNSTFEVIVTPDVEFPSDEGIDVTLYKTFTVLTGLDHLNGKLVSLMVDGYVIASPLNDVENYPELMVTGGTLTIPDGKRGAFVHVGLPYASDIETLDMDTVEQKPVLLESVIVHKVFIKVYNTRGLYVGSKFPVNNYVDGLVDPEVKEEDLEFGNIGNAAQKPVTKRLEITIPNDWQSHGRICIRQVDPLPFEILSIIPDVEVS